MLLCHYATYNTERYSTLLSLIAPHRSYNCNNTNYTTVQLQLCYGTSAGVISRHFPELTPAAWHTAHARHERSPAIWNSYWHTDGQSGTFLKQAIEIYLFTMRFIHICVFKVNKFISVWTVRTTIFRMAHRVSWYFQHINLEMMDAALLWFLQ